MKSQVWVLLVSFLLVFGIVGCGDEPQPLTEAQAIAKLVKLRCWRMSARDGERGDFIGSRATDTGLVHLKGLTNLWNLDLSDT